MTTYDTFTIPADVVDALAKVKDADAQSEALGAIFRRYCLGKKVDPENDIRSPFAWAAFIVIETMMERSKRRAEVNAAYYRRRVGAQSCKTLTKPKEGERKEEEKAKEKIPPHPPIRERQKEVESKEQETRALRAGAGTCVGASASTYASMFASFWQAYPRKRKKGDAQKAFIAAAAKVPRDERSALLASMLEAIEAQKKSRDWIKDGGQYIPYPATWLRASAWEDELEAEAGAIEACSEERGRIAANFAKKLEGGR